MFVLSYILLREVPPPQDKEVITVCLNADAMPHQEEQPSHHNKGPQRRRQRRQGGGGNTTTAGNDASPMPSAAPITTITAAQEGTSLEPLTSTRIREAYIAFRDRELAWLYGLPLVDQERLFPGHTGN